MVQGLRAPRPDSAQQPPAGGGGGRRSRGRTSCAGPGPGLGPGAPGAPTSSRGEGAQGCEGQGVAGGSGCARVRRARMWQFACDYHKMGPKEGLGWEQRPLRGQHSRQEPLGAAAHLSASSRGPGTALCHVARLGAGSGSGHPSPSWRRRRPPLRPEGGASARRGASVPRPGHQMLPRPEVWGSPQPNWGAQQACFLVGPAGPPEAGAPLLWDSGPGGPHTRT